MPHDVANATLQANEEARRGTGPRGGIPACPQTGVTCFFFSYFRRHISSKFKVSL